MGSKKRIVRLQRKVLQAAALGSLKLLRTILHSHVKRPSRKEQQRKSRKRGREDDDKKFGARESRRQKKRSRKAQRREDREEKNAYRRGGDLKRKEVEEGFISDEGSEESDEHEEIRYPKRAKRGGDQKFGTRKSHRQKKRSRKAEQREQTEVRETHRRGSDRKTKEVGKGFNSDEGRENSDPTEEEEGEEEIRKSGNGRHEKRRSSEGGQSSKDDDSSSSNDDRWSSGEESNDLSTRAESDVEEEIRHKRSGRAISGETVRSILNCRDGEGQSPLHHACRAGSEDLVKYLISKGASVHARDSKGDTPLHIAAKLGPASLVAILKDADADMETFNDEGVTPSDILGEKEAAASRKAKISEVLNDQQKWNGHLAEELSDNEDPWWGGTEWGESDRPDWEDPLLERMAESRQGRGLYNNEPFSLRDFLRAEKNKTRSGQERKPRRKGHPSRPREDDTRKSPQEVVIGPTLKISVPAQSYSQRWKTFSESYNLCLSYSNVPFPVEEGKEENLREVLLLGINDPSMQRAALRKEMLKWHPDKFLLKFGAKLQGPDHDRIVARVNGISEAIHQLYKKLTTE